MYIVTFSTKSESGDNYLYSFKTKTKPSEEQLLWWLKENASDVSSDICYESIQESEIINLNDLEDVNLPKKDNKPEIEFL